MSGGLSNSWFAYLNVVDTLRYVVNSRDPARRETLATHVRTIDAVTYRLVLIFSLISSLMGTCCFRIDPWLKTKAKH